ncbi:hypothetical protein [Paenibacillus sp. NAIST15-1]|nr:hypothetical protein [Paenibacillus sp. NAIST15-1]
MVLDECDLVSTDCLLMNGSIPTDLACLVEDWVWEALLPANDGSSQ